ncbi:MAG: hypothetical protein QGH48_00010 [Candidatus Poseidoniia archaeon]|nr:hypothetical protein [Candidatus Poseidoniia archaeon]MDP6591489.1 hypothetical protein [Candidatus Poseidoniia archaeon]MDP7095937.1 hypothetical protein [Candidatus Poseidoniia archaeon]MDP7444124.1 hypothetical protein [Candidatus Poseidoniia archaeon]HJN31865.1 hypothetical protein [Candidatus Poseidoniia archaeon]|tara:strand:+ start:134 stop:1132 length:999 start_codon:yes stop_codon:yes gene_type:complete
MLVLLEGWNYVMELYFWVILAAILLVSMTILLARPSHSKYLETQSYDLEEASGTEEISEGIDNPDEMDDHKEEPEPDEEIEIPPEVIKKQWAISFAVFGLIFIMFGGIVLWIFDLEFTTFLGSCMIYVGMMSLIKGISFQIPEERVIITGFMPVLIFGINFFLLGVLLGVIGQSAWMVQTDERKAGDLFLIYILPYLMWRIVPSFSKKKSEPSEEDDEYSSGYSRLRNFLPQSMKFVIFIYLIFNITSNYIFIPSLRQYAKVGFDIGIYFVAISLIIRIIITFLEYRVGEPKEADEKDDLEEERFEEEMDEMREERDDGNLQKRDTNEEDVE